MFCHERGGIYMVPVDTPSFLLYKSSTGLLTPLPPPLPAHLVRGQFALLGPADELAFSRPWLRARMRALARGARPADGNSRNGRGL